MRERLISEARRIEEDSLFSAKGHFSSATMWGKAYLWLGIPAAVLAAIAGVSALSRFDNSDVVSGVLALVVAGLAAVTTFLNPSERTNLHHAFGTRFNSLRNNARIFREIDCGSQEPDEELIRKLKELANRRDELNEQSPQIGRWAYQRAKKSIEAGEAEYEVNRVKTS